MTKVRFSIALLFIFGMSNVLSAQTYLDVSGQNIDFTNIVEASGLGLFGQPTVNPPDILNFPVDGFQASASDGAVDFIFGSVQMNLSSNSGLPFNSVSLDEFGVWFNTGNSTSSVAAFLTVVTADGIFSDSFNFNFGAGTDLWIGNATVTFPATLNAQVFFHNLLLASSKAGQTAFISKRKAFIEVGVVPEPSAFVLGAVGLALLAGRRRR